MDREKSKEKAFGRFEKVLRFYWDGVPTPPFVQREDERRTKTFLLRQLNYSPDYYGSVQDVMLTLPDVYYSFSFTPLSVKECDCSSSMSSRIGSHYSPLVGTFIIREASKKLTPIQNVLHADTVKVRIPLENCEDDKDDRTTVNGQILYEYRKYLRMTKLVELYEPLIKEFVPINSNSLRNIVILATKGFGEDSKKHVVREISLLRDEYVRWIGQAIHFYMCKNTKITELLAPLQLKLAPEPKPYKLFCLDKDTAMEAKGNYQSAKSNLERSQLWSGGSQLYFLALKALWENRFRHLVILDLSTTQWETSASGFLSQISRSMQAAFTRIRIEFYANVEDFFFSYIQNSREVLTMNESQLQSSAFQKIFIATRIFFVNHIRELIFYNLENIIHFFQCNGIKGGEIAKVIAQKHPVLTVEMIVGENYQPRSPSFAGLLFGLSEIFDDLLLKSNSFPQVEAVVLRTLKLNSSPISVVTSAEINCLRTFVMSIIDRIGRTIDLIASSYAPYASLPALSMHLAKSGSAEEVHDLITHLKNGILSIPRCSPDIVYCGCVSIRCKSVKAEYGSKWESLLQKLYKDLHKAIRETIDAAEAQCVATQKKLQRAPTTVRELEKYFEDIAAATQLANSLRENECNLVISKFHCMEECQVPIENELYYAALRLMKWPEELTKDCVNAEQAKQNCRPLLEDKLVAMRRDVRDNIRTLATGVTELYNMFNLDICDIAAQTCAELRSLSTQVKDTISTIIYQENSLGITVTDTFDDFYPLFNHFEIIEQYWTTINSITKLRSYYTSPVSSLNTTEMIESVRTWRRLLHNATRSVRGYQPLVRLGVQQEAALAKFESLEGLLRVLTTPGLRKNHWKEISRLLAAKLGEETHSVTDNSISLQKLLDADILDHLAEIRRITSFARNDFEVESLLEAMKSSAKKTYFQLHTIRSAGGLSFTKITPACYQSVLAQLEGYIRSCRSLRRRAELTYVVTSALGEWEAAAEKTRDVLLAYTTCMERFQEQLGYLNLLREAVQNGPCDVSFNVKVVIEKLKHAEDAVTALNAMLKKAQFSLYTAIVQDSVAEQLLTCKVSIEDSIELMRDELESKRSKFARFNFLTDEQLISILTPLNLECLNALLPFMYSHLSSVQIEDGFIVAFVSEGGYTIRAVAPIRITNTPIIPFMELFERTLSASLLQAVRACATAFHHSETSTWVKEWFPQLTNLALRINHTKDMHDALRLGGASGLIAYKSKVADLLEEFCRVSSSHESTREEQHRISASIGYVEHMRDEVHLAMEAGVTNPGELNATAMLQTHLTTTGIDVRTLGMSLPYGMELLGRHAEAYLSPDILEKARTLFCALSVSVPLLRGDLQQQKNVMGTMSSLLGRRMIHVHCFRGMTVDTLRPLMRAALLGGFTLCLQNYEYSSSTEIEEFLRFCLRKVREGLVSGKEDVTISLPLGSNGALVDVRLNASFMCLLTTSSYSSLPQSLVVEYRTISTVPIPFRDLTRGFLFTCGILHTSANDGVDTWWEQFAVLYAQFRELRPSLFTMGGLVSVLFRCLESATWSRENLRECSCQSFWLTFEKVLREEEELQRLFEYHVVETLGLSAIFLTALYESTGVVDTQLMRFSGTMRCTPSVALVGPSFAGKAKLWKQWMGSAKYTVLNPSLLTTEEVYGKGPESGLLRTIANNAEAFKEAHHLVVECGRFMSASAMDWPNFAASSMAGKNIVTDPRHRVIVTTQSMTPVNPRWATEVVLFYVEGESDWRVHLQDCLGDAPHKEVAFDVLKVVLPPLLEATTGKLCSTTGEVDPCKCVSLEEFIILCHQCCSLYRKWIPYASEVLAASASLDEEAETDEPLFAARTAIFAACWSVGFATTTNVKDMSRTLSQALQLTEGSLSREVSERWSIIEPVLPPLEDGNMELLTILCTPVGWKTFAEADRMGFSCKWATFSHIHPSAYAWSLLFPMASRVPFLMAAEYMVDCGQSVWLRGAADCGKTSLLQTVRLCDRWIPLTTSANQRFSPTMVQDGIYERILLRSDGRYGPSVGRRLVVTIDDVHLSMPNSVFPTSALPDGEEDVTGLAGALLAFVTKHNAICTPSHGFVPVTDLAFFFSSKMPVAGTQVDPSVARSTIQMCLPPLEGSEVYAGVQSLFEAACGRKRADGFAEQWSDVVVRAHSFFLQALGEIREDAEHPSSLSELQKHLPQRFRELLHVVDCVRQNLVTSVPDVQLCETAVCAIFKYHCTVLRRVGIDEEAIATMRTQFSTMAQRTLLDDPPAGKEKPLVVAVDKVAETASTLDAASAEDWDTVAEWIAALEVAHDDVIEQPLRRLYASEGGAAARRVAADSEKDGTAESTLQSSIVSYGSAANTSIIATIAPMMANPASGGGGGGDSITSRPEGLPHSRINSFSKPRSFTGRRMSNVGNNSTLSRSDSFVSGGNMLHSLKPLSTTHQTTWLTVMAMRLAGAVQSAAEPHRVLIGTSTFGLHRLLRLISCATKLPLIILRGERGVYNVELFKKEMRSVIKLAMLADTRFIVYVPKDLIKMEGIVNTLDAIARVGDVSTMFTDAERVTLAKGFQLTQQRTLRSAVFTDDFDLRRRIRRCFSFIVQVGDAAAKERLGADSPFFQDTPGVVLLPTTLEMQLHRELVRAMGKSKNEAYHTASAEVRSSLTEEKLIEVIAQMYERVKSWCREVTTEMLLAFAHSTRDMSVRVLERMCSTQHNASLTLTRGDEASAQIKSDATRVKAIVDELESCKKKLAGLQKDMAEVMEAEKTFRDSAEEERKLLEAQEAEVQAKEAKMQEEQTKCNEALATAVLALRRVKLTHIRAMSTMRLPEKGALLMRTVYKVLGEELPKRNSSPSEVWTAGQKLVCSQEFVQRFTALDPNEVQDAVPLLACEHELSEVRYNEVSPFAQLLAEYMVAFIAHVRHRVEDFEPTLAVIEEEKTKFGGYQDKIKELEEKADIMHEEVEATQSDIHAEERHHASLLQQQEDLAARGQRLAKYVSLVDRFTSFIDVAAVKQQTEAATFATGDAILLSAFYTLLAFQPSSAAAELYQELRGVLEQHGLPSSPKQGDHVRALLFHSHTRRVDMFAPTTLPLRHQMGLFSCMERISCRWLLFCGSCDTYEAILKEYLSVECTGLSVITATTNKTALTEHLIQCLTDGEGVLLRDVHAKEVFDTIRDLMPLAEVLNTHRCENNMEKFNYHALGRDLEVHPKFFLICTTNSSYVCTHTNVPQWMDVIYLDEPVDTSYRYERFLYDCMPSASTKKDIHAEVQQRRHRFYEELKLLRQVHAVACKTISSDLQDIADKGDALLTQMDKLLSDVDYHDTQLMQLAVQKQGFRKKQWEMWGPLKPAMVQLADTLAFIERDKLGHFFSDDILDHYFYNMTSLSRELTSRIAPQTFTDLVREYKHFYVVVQLTEYLLQDFACGWPEYFQGFFSLVFMTGAFEGTNIISAQRGVLYAHGLEWMNAKQFAVLKQLMTTEELWGQDTNRQREMIRAALKESGDALLASIAEEKDGDSSSTAASVRPSIVASDGSGIVPTVSISHQSSVSAEYVTVAKFFRCVAHLNLEAAEHIARLLCYEFFRTVKDSKTLKASSTDQPFFDSTSYASYASYAFDDLDPAEAMYKDHFGTDAQLMTLPVQSYLQLKDRCARRCIPLIYRTWMPLSALNKLMLEAQAHKWTHQVHPATTTKELQGAMDLIHSCFRSRLTEKKGCWISIVLSPTKEIMERESFRNGMPVTVGTRFTRCYAYMLYQLIAVYRSYGPQGASSSRDHLPVLLSFIVTPDVSSFLWRSSAPRQELVQGGLTVDLIDMNPRQHLASLLSNEFFTSWDAPVKSTVPRFRAEVQDARTVDRKTDGPPRSATTTSLRSLVTLFLKELLLLHVGVGKRRNVTRFDWIRRQTVEGRELPELPELLDVDISDLGVAAMAALLQAWAIKSQSRMDATLRQPATKRRKFSEQVSAIRILSASMHADATTSSESNSVFVTRDTNKGRRAFLFHRSQRSAWRLLGLRREAAPLKGFTLVDCLLAIARDPAASSTTSGHNVDMQLSHLAFSVFQKYVLLLLLNEPVSLHERYTLARMIRLNMLAPSADNVVRFPLMDSSPVGPLVLASSTMKELAAHVHAVPSPLLELCGDAVTVRRGMEWVDYCTRKRFFKFYRDGRAATTAMASAAASFTGPMARALSVEELQDNPLRALLTTHKKAAPVAWQLAKRELYELSQQLRPGSAAARHLLQTAECICMAHPHTPPAVWLPALRCPWTVMHLLARQYSGAAAASTDGRGTPLLVLIVTQRRLLTPTDVRLIGAQLSSNFLYTLRECTGWGPAASDDGKDKDTEDERAPQPTDVVVALREVYMVRPSTATAAKDFSVSVTNAGRSCPVYMDSAGGIATRYVPPPLYAFLWQVTAPTVAAPVSRPRVTSPPPKVESVFVTEVDEDFTAQRGGGCSPFVYHYLKYPIPLFVRPLADDRDGSAAPLGHRAASLDLLSPTDGSRSVSTTTDSGSGGTWKSLGEFDLCIVTDGGAERMNTLLEEQMQAHGSLDYHVSVSA